MDTSKLMKPKSIPKKPYIPKPKFSDEDCMVLFKIWKSEKSKWKGKSDPWIILLKGFMKRHKASIEKGEKLLEDEKK